MRLARVISAFDQPNPVAESLVEKADLDVLQLDYVWPKLVASVAKYAPGLLRQLRTLHKTLYLDSKLHLITNAGGSDPIGCVENLAGFLCEHDDPSMLLTAIRGDNVLPYLDELVAEGVELKDFETGATPHEITQPLLAANVELGAGPLTTALAEDSRIVVAGCYDISAPAIATAVAAMQWEWEQLDALAQLAIAVQLPQTLLNIDSAGSLTVQAYLGETLDQQDLLASISFAASNRGLIRHADVSSQIKHFDLQQASHGLLNLCDVTGQSTAGEWLLRLTYQTGYCAEGLLSFPDAEICNRAADRLRRFLDVENDQRRTVHIDRLANAQSAEPSLIFVRCQSIEQEPCADFVNALTTFPAQTNMSGCQFTGSSPSWQPELTQLRCPVPRDAIAISVDTRPAKEWR